MVTTAPSCRQTGQPTPSNILIEANLHLRGTGGATENIFMAVKDDGTTRYRQVRIIDNLSVGAAYHGVTVMGVDSLEVAGNQMLEAGEFNSRIWIDRASEAASHDNLASAYLYGAGNPGDTIRGLATRGLKVVDRKPSPAEIAAAVGAFRAAHPQIPN